MLLIKTKKMILKDKSSLLNINNYLSGLRIKKEEIMPIDAYQFFYDCENCKTLLKPKRGDCCVYCSYGIVKCRRIKIGEIAAKNYFS